MSINKMWNPKSFAVLARAVLLVVCLEGIWGCVMSYRQVIHNLRVTELLYPGCTLYGVEEFFVVLAFLYLLGVILGFLIKNRPVLLGVGLTLLFLGIGAMEGAAHSLLDTVRYTHGAAALTQDWMWLRNAQWAAWFALAGIGILIIAPYIRRWYVQKYLSWKGKNCVAVLFKILFSAALGFACVTGFLSLFPDYLKVQKGWDALFALCPDCSSAGVYSVFILCGLLFAAGLYAALFPPKEYVALPLTSLAFFFAVGILLCTIDFYIDPAGYNYEGSMRYNYWPHYLFSVGAGVGGIILMLAPKLHEYVQSRKKNPAVNAAPAKSKNMRESN